MKNIAKIFLVAKLYILIVNRLKHFGTHMIKLPLIVLILIFSSRSVLAQEIKSIAFCGDGSGWPPFHYMKEGDMVGYDIDVVKEIFKNTGTKITTIMPPWKECLSKVNEGVTFQVAFSSSYKDERAETYIYTKPYYDLHGYYYYAKSSYPKGLKIANAEELLDYKVCGLAGYNYNRFGIETHKVDTTTINFVDLVKKIKNQYCDIFLARDEIIRGFKLIGNDLLKNDIASKPANWTRGEKFYMLVSRNTPQSEQIVRVLNQGIEKMLESEQLADLLNKYLQSP